MSSPAVVWLRPNDAAGASPLAEELARDHRVVTAVSPELGQFVLIGQSNGAAAALALACAAGDACVGLILMAPVLAPLPSAKDAPDMPMLLLLGTDDARVPPSSAGALCAALPRAHPILIYGAGHALDRERVEAVASVLRDFIERREKFIVRNTSDLVFP